MKKNKKGFTLIELLAVIVILGIIITIVVSNVVKYINKARKGSYVDAYKVLVKDMQTQLMANEMDNGTASLAICNDNSTVSEIKKRVNENDYKGSYKEETLKMQVEAWKTGEKLNGYTVTINPGSNFSSVTSITCPVVSSSGVKSACAGAEIRIHLALDGTITSGR